MIPESLLTAYRKTRFVVECPNAEIVLRVGERNLQLDELLQGYGVGSCAFVTAWNPGSWRFSDSENARRNEEMLLEVQRHGFLFLPGRGVGENTSWPPEASILVIGILRDAAIELAQHFEQAAIVFVELCNPVELVLC